MAVAGPQAVLAQPTAVVESTKQAAQIVVDEVSHQGRRLLVQSPYDDEGHLLDLDTLDNENELLARALTKLHATRKDYATAPYEESFNWSEVLQELKDLVEESGKSFNETSFYVVAFRSQIKPSTDYSHLGELDKAAHAEAVESGGFLKRVIPHPRAVPKASMLTLRRYWFGSPDSELRNLATCLWRSRDDAIAGGRGPAHKKAAGSTRSLYAYWKIDQHRLTVRDGAESWEIVPW